MGELDAKFTGLVGKAALALDDESSAVRLSAAKATFDNFLRIHEIASFEKRLTAVEEKANAIRGTSNPVRGNIDPTEVETIARRLLADREFDTVGDAGCGTDACPAIGEVAAPIAENDGGRLQSIEDRVTDELRQNQAPLNDELCLVRDGADARPIRNIDDFMIVYGGWKGPKGAD